MKLLAMLSVLHAAMLAIRENAPEDFNAPGFSSHPLGFDDGGGSVKYSNLEWHEDPECTAIRQRLPTPGALYKYRVADMTIPILKDNKLPGLDKSDVFLALHRIKELHVEIPLKIRKIRGEEVLLDITAGRGTFIKGYLEKLEVMIEKWGHTGNFDISFVAETKNKDEPMFSIEVGEETDQHGKSALKFPEQLGNLNFKISDFKVVSGNQDWLDRTLAKAANFGANTKFGLLFTWGVIEEEIFLYIKQFVSLLICPELLKISKTDSDGKSPIGISMQAAMKLDIDTEGVLHVQVESDSHIIQLTEEGLEEMLNSYLSKLHDVGFTTEFDAVRKWVVKSLFASQLNSDVEFRIDPQPVPQTFKLVPHWGPKLHASFGIGGAAEPATKEELMAKLVCFGSQAAQAESACRRWSDYVSKAIDKVAKNDPIRTTYMQQWFGPWIDTSFFVLFPGLFHNEERIKQAGDRWASKCEYLIAEDDDDDDELPPASLWPIQFAEWLYKLKNDDAKRETAELLSGVQAEGNFLQTMSNTAIVISGATTTDRKAMRLSIKAPLQKLLAAVPPGILI